MSSRGLLEEKGATPVENRLAALKKCATEIKRSRNLVMGYILEEVDSLLANKEQVAKDLALNLFRHQEITRNNFVMQCASYVLHDKGKNWYLIAFTSLDEKKNWIKKRMRAVYKALKRGYTKEDAEEKVSEQGKIEAMDRFIDELCSFWLYECGRKERYRQSHADMRKAILKAAKDEKDDMGALLRFLVGVLEMRVPSE